MEPESSLNVIICFLRIPCSSFKFQVRGRNKWAKKLLSKTFKNSRRENPKI